MNWSERKENTKTELINNTISNDIQDEERQNADNKTDANRKACI